MYLIQGKPNQTHQANIDYLCEPSDTYMFLINITIRPLHTKKAPKPPVETIGFGPQ